jgi:aspartate aminotransferase-like enzyme
MAEVLWEKHGHVGILVLNRTDKMNALTPEGLDLLRWYLGDRLEDACCSPTVTAVRCPEGILARDVIRIACARIGALFQRGLGRFADTTFRIGHLGVVGAHDVARGLDALEGTLAAPGAPCPDAHGTP